MVIYNISAFGVQSTLALGNGANHLAWISKGNHASDEVIVRDKDAKKLLTVNFDKMIAKIRLGGFLGFEDVENYELLIADILLHIGDGFVSGGAANPQWEALLLWYKDALDMAMNGIAGYAEAELSSNWPDIPEYRYLCNNGALAYFENVRLGFREFLERFAEIANERSPVSIRSDWIRKTLPLRELLEAVGVVS